MCGLWVWWIVCYVGCGRAWIAGLLCGPWSTGWWTSSGGHNVEGLTRGLFPPWIYIGAGGKMWEKHIDLPLEEVWFFFLFFFLFLLPLYLMMMFILNFSEGFFAVLLFFKVIICNLMYNWCTLCRSNNLSLAQRPETACFSPLCCEMTKFHHFEFVIRQYCVDIDKFWGGCSLQWVG